MTSADTYAVAVVGYRPTGATAADVLGQLGLKVVVVERDPDIYNRARAISTDEEVRGHTPERRTVIDKLAQFKVGALPLTHREDVVPALAGVGIPGN